MSWPAPRPDECVAREVDLFGIPVILDSRLERDTIAYTNGHPLFPVGGPRRETWISAHT